MILNTRNDLVDHCCAAWNRPVDQPWRFLGRHQTMSVNGPRPSRRLKSIWAWTNKPRVSFRQHEATASQFDDAIELAHDPQACERGIHHQPQALSGGESDGRSRSSSSPDRFDAL
jgi:hypothetical protein